MLNYQTLQDRNFERKGIANKQLQYVCQHCGVDVTTVVKSFLRRKYRVPTCRQCYFDYHVYDEDWRRNNSQAQLIAQNRPEVKAKQRASQKARYIRGGEALREHYREIGRSLWRDPDYRRNQVESARRNWQDPEYRTKVLTNSKKQYVGIYNDVCYYSLIELAFLMWCETHQYSVKNYDLPGIPYVDEHGKPRHYYPDFILNSDTIIEVKGRGRWYQINRETIGLKHQALLQWCSNNTRKCRLVFDKDLGKRLWKQAKEWHIKCASEAKSSSHTAEKSTI